MKKLLMAAVGLTGILASCGVDVVVDPGTSTLKLTQVNEFKTQYTTTTDLNDQSGNKIASAGDSVICNNLNNRIRVAFTWTGDLGSAQFRLRGLTTDKVTSAATVNYPSGFTNGGAEATIAPGAAPQSINGGLSAQAIVVTPIKVTKLYGRSYLEMRIFDNAGRAGQVPNSNDGITFQSVTALPIVDCASTTATPLSN